MNAFKKIKESLLIDRLKKGDPDAFAQIYDSFVDHIYRYIFFKVSDQHIAEDLTSNTFLKCWEYIRDEKKEIENIKAFLYRIARNLVIDYYRTRTETTELSAAVGMGDQKLPLPDELISISQDTNMLLKTLTKLPDDYNDLITLRYIEEYSIREIADILGKTENNVRVTLHRAIQALKNKINLPDQ